MKDKPHMQWGCRPRTDHGPSTHREDRDGSPEGRALGKVETASTLVHALLYGEPAPDAKAAINQHCWRGEGEAHMSRDDTSLWLAYSRARAALQVMAATAREEGRRLKECRKAYNVLLEAEKQRREGR